MTLAQVVIFVSFLSFIVVGFLVKKSNMKSYSDFTMSKNKLNWFTIAAGISMTFAGGAAILSTASVGHIFKWYSLIDPISLILGILIVLLLYGKYKNNNGTTISDLLACNHRGLALLIGIVTSFAFVLIVAANFVALSKLISPYFPSINPLWITFIASTLVFSYVFLGGFKSVTRTDILQYVLINVLLVLPVLYFVLQNAGHLSAETVTHEFVAMPLDYMVLFAIPMVFTPLSQDINLRIKSAKSKAHGMVGLFVGGLFYATIAVCAAWVGVYLGNMNIVLPDPEQSIPFFFQMYFPTFGVLAITAVLAAIVSTLDSYVLNSITAISNDIIKPCCKSKSVSKTIKMAALVTYVVAMMIALFFNKILVLALTSLLIYISVLTPIALGRLLKVSEKWLFVASLINVIAIIMMETFSVVIAPKAIVYPLFGCAIVLLAKGISRLKCK